MNIVPRATDEEMDTLRQLVGEFGDQGWEKTWEINVLPWDKLGAVQPPLRALLLSDEQDWPRQGRALVPGCGRGYDPIYIAATLGLDTLAVDISTTALQAADALLASTSDVSPGKVTFREMDFFTLSSSTDQLFDLVYDYTFFVTIPPARRAEWGRQMSTLVKPGGFLIALVYPLNPRRDDGPPYYTRPDHYVEALGQNWEKVIERVPEESIPTHVGLEYLMVWRRL